MSLPSLDEEEVKGARRWRRGFAIFCGRNVHSAGRSLGQMTTGICREDIHALVEEEDGKKRGTGEDRGQ